MFLRQVPVRVDEDTEDLKVPFNGLKEKTKREETGEHRYNSFFFSLKKISGAEGPKQDEEEVGGRVEEDK